MERTHRLKRSSDFARVRADGRSWAHPLMVLAAAHSGLEISRFGFITGRRIGKAVRRNRVRRLLREAVRQNLPYVAGGWDCVLIARAPMSEAGLAETSAALVELLKRAALWGASGSGVEPAGERKQG